MSDIKKLRRKIFSTLAGIVKISKSIKKHEGIDLYAPIRKIRIVDGKIEEYD